MKGDKQNWLSGGLVKQDEARKALKDGRLSDGREFIVTVAERTEEGRMIIILK